MLNDESIPKAYNAKDVEDKIYLAWTDSGYFTPENLPNFENLTETFTIVLPPPNVTGTLHMGHAVMLAIEDAMVRFQRMSRKKTLWLPGTDHAAIATQSKVEKIIFNEEGLSRHDLGRDKFLERVRSFAQDSHDTIVNQMKKMGASVDWSREAYTLDSERSKAVRTAFRKMYDDELIYRGYRVINWDPVGQTTISDDELVYKEGKATLYTFKYSKDFPIPISTTRPETKVGDTAVAVHPDDERYKEFIGQEFDIDFAGNKLHIKVIADTEVEPQFGTGALGVTPAHSVIDSEIAKRHGLEMVQVIGEDAKMMQSAGNIVANKTTLEARKIIVEWLEANGLLINSEEIAQNISTAERTGGVVEPLPKMQWFIDVNKQFKYRQSKNHPILGLEDGQKATLKQLMQHVVREKEIEILPERFEKTYFHWIDNLRDWNISRQIWFGHQIPVWYKGNEIVVGEEPGGVDWEQDPDTLDTWFSAGLWTFSTLGWPNKEGDFSVYHPTQVLETGYDILFFWVARMILMSTYLLGEVPFKTVYLHGLVRDEQGRKMSKTLGNIINPLDMIGKYGADATRLSLLIGATPGNDTKLSEDKIASYRNFTNKLWNISRFIFMTVQDVENVDYVEPETLADKWILGRLSEVIAKVTEYYKKYEFSYLGEVLRDFTWNEFADWYLEIAKVQKGENTNRILLYVLERLLKMWHPFMPFVTEEIYKKFNDGLLIIAHWPDAEHTMTKEIKHDFDELQNLVTAIRNIRAEYKVPQNKMISVVLSIKRSKDSETIIRTLAKVDDLIVSDKKPEQSASAVVGDLTVYIPLSGLVDIEAEKSRLQKELGDAEKFAEVIRGKLANDAFINNAPENIVEIEKNKLSGIEEKIEKLKKEISSI